MHQYTGDTKAVRLVNRPARYDVDSRESRVILVAADPPFAVAVPKGRGGGAD